MFSRVAIDPNNDKLARGEDRLSRCLAVMMTGTHWYIGGLPNLEVAWTAGLDLVTRKWRTILLCAGVKTVHTNPKYQLNI